MSIDLHLHTHHSDGTWSPADLVAYAISKKLKTIAITDHDTTAGLGEAKVAAGARLEIIPGIEINSILRKADGTGRDIHILGYFINPDNQALQEILRQQRDARMRHAQRCIEQLQTLGIVLCLEKLCQSAGNAAIGKLHLAQAIIEAGGAKDATEAFERFLKRGSRYYVEKDGVTPQEAVGAIRKAGGIASIAHPGREDEFFPLILELKSYGLTAIEAYHRSHSSDRSKHYLQFAERNDFLVTGGSDCHGPYQDHAPLAGTITLPERDWIRLRHRTEG